MSKAAPFLHDTLPDATPVVLLRDVADLLRAPLIRTDTSRGGTLFRLASIGDLPEYGFIPTPVRTLRLKGENRDARRYLLEDHDVIMTMVGTIGRIGIVPDGREDPWLPASNMVVVRFRDRRREHAAAFVAYIRSEHGRRLLNHLRHGKTIPIISKKAFSRTPIPELTPSLHRTVNAHLRREQELFRKRDEITRQIENLQNGFLSRSVSVR